MNKGKEDWTSLFKHIQMVKYFEIINKSGIKSCKMKLSKPLC